METLFVATIFIFSYCVWQNDEIKREFIETPEDEN